MTNETKLELRRFAHYRLARRGVRSLTGPDIIQDALLSILCGFKPGPYGRHPTARDLENPSAFAGYLRGAINSLVEKEARKVDRQPGFEPLIVPDEEEEASELWIDYTAISPDEDVAFHDLQTEFFLRLRARSPRHLHAVIDRWEPVFAWSEQIPLNGAHRRHRFELRRLARRVLTELGEFLH